MKMADLIAPECVYERASFPDKATALRELSAWAGEFTHIDAKIIEAALKSREDLGSTGVGHGVAVPHARIPGLTQFVGLFVRLSKPIEFASIDAKLVDLIFLLLIPPDRAAQQVEALAAMSRRLRDKNVLAGLRAAKGPSALYDLLVGPSTGE